MVLYLCGPNIPPSQSAPEVASGPLGVWRSPSGRAPAAPRGLLKPLGGSTVGIWEESYQTG